MSSLFLEPKVFYSLVFAVPGREGDVYGWGHNQYFQRGDFRKKPSFTPLPIKQFNNQHIVAVFAGYDFTAALSVSGAIHTCGDNFYGALGYTLERNAAVPPNVYPYLPMSEKPQVVTDLTSHRIIKACAGGRHLIVLTDKFIVFTFGCNLFGQLGNGTQVHQAKPQKLATLVQNDRIETISAGFNHSFVVTQSGKLYGFGRNDLGQIGNPHAAHALHPALVQPLHFPPIVSVHAGYAHSIAVAANGSVYSFGSNSNGQLGLGNTMTMSMDPRQIDFFKNIYSVRIFTNACGNHTFALSNSTNVIYGWGRNCHGQLGLGNAKDIDVPTEIVSLAPLKVTDISCGYDHTMILTAQGHVYCMGLNLFGALGTHLENDQLLPIKVSALRQTYAISAGHNHSCAIVRMYTPFEHRTRLWHADVTIIPAK